MPYVGYDLVVPSTTVLAEQTKQLRGGLNVKPSPYVTLKVEASRIVPTAAFSTAPALRFSVKSRTRSEGDDHEPTKLPSRPRRPGDHVHLRERAHASAEGDEIAVIVHRSNSVTA